VTTFDIERMTKIERLRIMEIIWNSLLQDERGIESPKWHENILLTRKKKIKQGKSQFLSLEELKDFNK